MAERQIRRKSARYRSKGEHNPSEKYRLNKLSVNWTAVANAVLTHSELRQDILRALWRTLNSELKNYCSSDSVLKHRTPKELVQKSRKILPGFTDGIITVCHCCLCLKNHARERI